MTPEEKKAVEAEEQKRFEEEQFREQVRTQLRTPPQTYVLPDPEPRRPFIGIAAGFILALAIGVFGYILMVNLGSRPPGEGTGQTRLSSLFSRTPKTRLVSSHRSIESNPVLVRARSYTSYKIAVEPDMVAPVINGEFRAVGGSGNDIRVILTDEINYTNWVNGHRAQVLWQTAGQQTAGRFNIPVGAGTYYLVLSNTFALLSDKQVVLNAGLSYKRVETYNE